MYYCAQVLDRAVAVLDLLADSLAPRSLEEMYVYFNMPFL
jgi:hypothetical protein